MYEYNIVKLRFTTCIEKQTPGRATIYEKEIKNGKPKAFQGVVAQKKKRAVRMGTALLVGAALPQKSAGAVWQSQLKNMDSKPKF